ncbi:hypothetical protein HU200_063186 [Digitaria exilis]|uniref:Transcription repressor n=1 Tax=Digitaria exilis TaxID=1010633 RepID=A0A835DVC0_9POAL|nr:hypothetical protein HU200_063186 [Digitaria exilis]
MRARGMSPAAAAKKRLGVSGAGGFGLGCGCRDAKAVAVAVAASSSATSPYSATATDTSTATTATTWRRGRAAALHPSSASGSTGTLTVPSASSSSFLWEEDADDGEEEVDCSKQRESSAVATTSFSGLLRQLNELEQSVVSWGRKSTSKEYFSPPPPPPPPPLPVKQRVVHSGGDDSKEGHGNFSPPPPPPPQLPERPAKQQVFQSGGDDSKAGHGNFSPPPPSPFELQTTQQNRKTKNIDKAVRPAGEVHSKSKQPPSPPLPLPPEQVKATSTEKGGKKEEARSFKKKEEASMFPTSQAPNHRKAKSGDAGTGRLDGTVLAVVKQSDDPLSDFRRSMVNMIVENRIATGDELRELLRHFLALNAPHHHDAILRAFTEIWDEAFSAAAKTPHRHREPAAVSARRPTPPRPRPTPPRRRHSPPPRVWR